MILSLQELKDITGTATRRTMLAALSAMGVHYVLGIDGWPRVSRDLMEEVLRGKTSKRRTRPNFEIEAQ